MEKPMEVLTIQELRDVLLSQLAERLKYETPLHYLSGMDYCHEARNGMDEFLIDVQNTAIYQELEGDSPDTIYSDYAADADGEFKYIVKVNGETIIRRCKSSNYITNANYVAFVLPDLYSMQGRRGLKLTGQEFYNLIEDERPVLINSETLLWPGGVSEPENPGDIIAIFDYPGSYGEVLEICDGDDIVLTNGSVAVKGVEIQPMEFALYGIPYRE